MWNQIRSPPVVQRTAKGISYIHSSSQGQLVVETYIVFALSNENYEKNTKNMKFSLIFY